MSNAGNATTQSAGQGWVGETRAWVTTDRVRIFGVAGGVVAVLALICLFLPNWFFSFVLAGVFGIMAVVLGLLSAATWWADRNGVTDAADLWDSGVEDTTARPEELFSGFQGFREDPRA